MTNRSTTSDLLKGVAVVLMIQVHVVELFATPAFFDSQAGKNLLFLGGPLCAPIFMILLGYYLASSKKTSRQLITRGIKIFLVGMLLNVLLNINLLFHIFIGKIDLPVFPFIFGVDILQLAGISIILLALLKKTLNRNILIALILSLLSAYMGQALLNLSIESTPIKYLFSYFIGISYWAYFPVFPWIAYPLLGYTFYQFNSRHTMHQLLQPSLKIILGLAYITFLSLSWSYAIDQSSNLQTYYHHGIHFFIWTVAFLSMYSLVVHEFGQIARSNLLFKYLKWLGQHVTTIYVIQWLIIGNTATIIYRSINSPILLGISFVGVLFISSLLAWGIQSKKKCGIK